MDYEKLYYQLFNDVSDAIEKLALAQQNAEERYVRETATLNFPGAEAPPPKDGGGHGQ